MKNPFYRREINKNHLFISWFLSWLCGFAAIADGIIIVLSFGFLCSDFHYMLVCCKANRLYGEDLD